MAKVVSQPLLSSERRGSKTSRRVALAVALAATLAAVATIAAAAGQWKANVRRASLLQARMQAIPATALAQEVPMMAQPVYYVPLSAAPGGGGAPVGGGGAPVTQQALAQPRPVVYYYVPESSLQVPHTAQLAENATATPPTGNLTASPAKFSCTKQNLIDVSKKIMPLWDECQKASDYVEPNKDAKRRLMGWVWQGSGSPTSPMPQLADNATAGAAAGANATAPAAGGVKLADCEAKALGNTCQDLVSCPNPVCSSYYSEDDIEMLCGVCTMKVSMWFGCFSRDATTVAVGRGKIAVGDLNVGDHVMSAGADGSIISSRVYFVHDHKDLSATVRIQHAQGLLELTPSHMVHVYTEACGESYCAEAKRVPAREITAGSRIYVKGVDGTVAQTVSAVSEGVAHVRYVLTEAENIVVDGVVASVQSTAAGRLETAPFRFVDYMWRGALQSKPVAAALAVVLESPALQAIEMVVNTIIPLFSRPGISSITATRMAIAPHVSL